MRAEAPRSGAFPRGYNFHAGSLPQFHTGGLVTEDGPAELLAGESVVPEGRHHEINQHAVPLESKATGAGTEQPDAQGRKVYHPTDASHVEHLKPIELKATELKSHPSDWKKASSDRYCGGSECADKRRQ